MSRAHESGKTLPAWAQTIQFVVALYLFEVSFSGFLSNTFGFPAGPMILDGAISLLLCAYLTAARKWRAIVFRRPSSWRSLLWFAPLLLPILYSLTGHVHASLVPTLPVILFYIIQSFENETIFNGLMLGAFLTTSRPRYEWFGALIVAVLQAMLVAAQFALVPTEKDFLTLLALIFFGTAASTFASAALRIRTGLLWPLILADVLGSITYYITLPPNPSPYPLTTHRLIYFLAEIAFGICVGLAALLVKRRPVFSASEASAVPMIAAEIAGASDVPTAPAFSTLAPRPPVSVPRFVFTSICVLLGLSILGCTVLANTSNNLGPFHALARTQDGSQRPYFTAVPGVACDHSGAFWVEDPEESYTCLPNGLLVVQKYFEYEAEDYFAFVGDDDSSVPFAAHSYHVQVIATVVSDLPGTCAEIHIHIQDFQGRQTFGACNDGTWDVGRCDLHCDTDVTLLSGTLPSTSPRNRFLLALDVTDSVTTFSVNGVATATLRDATYQSTNQLAIAMYGPENASTLPTVLFSDFSYTPLA